MTDHKASRTLVKSPPELWAECSDAASLARHLGEFGEIKITRLEPETSVAWEGELASGTVRIEPSAWGTKVTLTAQVGGRTAPAAPAPVPEFAVPVPEPPGRVPEPPALEPPAPEPSALAPEPPAPAAARPRYAEPAPYGRLEVPPRGFLARLRQRFAPPEPVRVAVEPAAAREPTASPEPPEPPEPQLDTRSALDTSSALAAALESLGQAHHRPFSRS